MKLKRTDKVPKWLVAPEELEADGALADHLLNYGYELVAAKPKKTIKPKEKDEVLTTEGDLPKEDK